MVAEWKVGRMMHFRGLFSPWAVTFFCPVLAAVLLFSTALAGEVDVGGALDQGNEIVREILSHNRGGQNTATSMSLKVQRP